MLELGGENSSRLVVGGLLADLSAEHYSWVATGDASNPDAQRVRERAEAFLERLGTLYDDAMILTLPDTYTGVTLQFLKKTSYYPIGKSVQAVGIGDWNKDPNAKAIVRQALDRVRVVVANMREYMKIYRPEHSWLYAFTAFRLPSPLAASASRADPQRKDAAMASLRRICREASLPEQQAYPNSRRKRSTWPSTTTRCMSGSSAHAPFGSTGRLAETCQGRVVQLQAFRLKQHWRTKTVSKERRLVPGGLMRTWRRAIPGQIFGAATARLVACVSITACVYSRGAAAWIHGDANWLHQLLFRVPYHSSERTAGRGSNRRGRLHSLHASAHRSITRGRGCMFLCTTFARSLIRRTRASPSVHGRNR